MTEWALIAVIWNLQTGSWGEQEIQNAVFRSPAACSEVAEQLLKEMPRSKDYAMLYKCRPRG